VRTSFSGRHIAARWWGGRGTGAVMATGSYEGSLSVEGTSGCHEPFSFTRRWSRRPWRLPHAGKRQRSQEPKLKDARRRSDIPRKRKRRQRCQRLDRFTGAVGRQRPRSELTHGRKAGRQAKRQDGSACPVSIRRSVLECRETLGPPVIPHGAQDSVGCPRDESRVVSWERTRYGYT
jgi:ribosomal protein S30